MSDEGEDFPLIVIFTVLSAFLIAAVLIMIYNRQVTAKIEGEISALLSELSLTVFQSFSTGTICQMNLPRDIGGYNYIIEIRDNKVFLVRMLEGPLRGREHLSVVEVKIIFEKSVFYPGESIFFTKVKDKLIVGSTKTDFQDNQEQISLSTCPPEFYFFAKAKGKEAAGIIGAFFHSKEDVNGYVWISDFCLGIRTNENRSLMVTFRKENYPNAEWNVLAAWIVEKIENTSIGETTDCPQLTDAKISGWLISADEIFTKLRSRTWADINGVVGIPDNAEIRMSYVLTRQGGYPAWKISFDGRIMFHQALPWWYMDNNPGFLIQTFPEMYPLD